MFVQWLEESITWDSTGAIWDYNKEGRSREVHRKFIFAEDCQLDCSRWSSKSKMFRPPSTSSSDWHNLFRLLELSKMLSYGTCSFYCGMILMMKISQCVIRYTMRSSKHGGGTSSLWSRISRSVFVFSIYWYLLIFLQRLPSEKSLTQPISGHLTTEPRISL